MNNFEASRWGSRLFIIAGFFMLLNTALLWIRLYSEQQMSILWPAIPAITAFTFSVLGLLKLYSRISSHVPLFAMGGAGFALLSCLSLGLAVVWILYMSVVGGGMPEQQPVGFLLLIATFMVSMILSFLSNAIAFLKHQSQRKVGLLLTVPVAMWGIMLLVGILQGMEIGLGLDYYTNAVIAASFLALGFTLKTSHIESA
ncbi:hypothetical protein [Alteromonas facilis]|uniref:hypothetical protein n=1 Tax=Alteromonas facilis TaxID=2048004 RepID=UPI000C29153D|nr:hypothetical protein [Alteromonas facilis]